MSNRREANGILTAGAKIRESLGAKPWAVTVGFCKIRRI